jgi:hypothetical protein
MTPGSKNFKVFNTGMIEQIAPDHTAAARQQYSHLVHQ